MSSLNDSPEFTPGNQEDIRSLEMPNSMLVDGHPSPINDYPTMEASLATTVLRKLASQLLRDDMELEAKATALAGDEPGLANSSLDRINYAQNLAFIAGRRQQIKNTVDAISLALGVPVAADTVVNGEDYES